MKFWNLPNTLTLFRIILIPFFVVVFYADFHYSRFLSAFLFLLAAITDWLDGFFARYLKQVSSFGTFLDPVADKLIVSVALVLLVSDYPTPWMAVPGLVIVCREILISALREWMAELGQRTHVKVSGIGKIKTTVQMIALLILLSQPATFNNLTLIGFILLYAAVILTLWSMMIYLIAAWRILRYEP